MNLIFVEFENDLQRLKRLITLINHIHEYPSKVIPSNFHLTTSEFEIATTNIYNDSKDCHADTFILMGTLLLYLAGRLENFIKEIFEDLCETLIAGSSNFIDLPKDMQENLVKYTAEVIANPRKYGHADNGIKAFISVLNDNLNNNSTIAVNSKCLSITSENLRPETLNDIFMRIGIKKIWQKIGQQACIQAYFETGDPGQAESEAKACLKEFMETRNMIAHPSGQINWPDSGKLQYYIEFSLNIGRAITELVNVFARTLINRNGGT